MDTERTETMHVIAAATARLVAAVAEMSDEDLRSPSLLAGWTRGHVVAHVARSCDAMRDMLIWASTGEGVPGYPSEEAREAGIAAGVGRSAAELTADLAESAAEFTAAVEETTDAAWDTVIETPTGVTFPTGEIPTRRLVEVELHHTDLGLGYRHTDWTPEFAAMDLAEPMRSWRADRMA